MKLERLNKPFFIKSKNYLNEFMINKCEWTKFLWLPHNNLTRHVTVYELTDYKNTAI